MAYVTKDTGRWNIIVNTSRGKVMLQMRWMYNWTKAAGTTDWNYDQRKSFHTQVDRTIWRTWSHKVKLRVTGASRFAKQFRNRDIPLDFDVKWVTSRPHWDVNVIKLPANASRTSWVNWGTKKVQLDTNDFGERTACNDEKAKPGMEGVFNLIPKATRDANPALKSILVDQTCRAGFETIPHEYGHALGNQNDDEYEPDSAHRADTSSMVNIGTEIRRRHLTAVLTELNSAIPDCQFRIHTIRN